MEVDYYHTCVLLNSAAGHHIFFLVIIKRLFNQETPPAVFMLRFTVTDSIAIIIMIV